jgi:hypothetical protein
MRREHATGERERKQWAAGDGAKRGSVVPALAVALALLLPPQARAQEYSQLWVNLTFDWVQSERLTYELDFEPKALVNAPAGQPGWKNLDVTPSVSFSAAKWVDPTGRFANRQRFRAGFGYRRSFHWRFETLYIWARSRDTFEEQFETSERILDVRIKRFF